jgi:hypothetical protein
MISDGNQIIPGGNIHIISFSKNVKLFFVFYDILQVVNFGGSYLKIEKKKKRRILFLPVINSPREQNSLNLSLLLKYEMRNGISFSHDW